MLRPVDATPRTHGKDPSDALQTHCLGNATDCLGLVDHATDCLGDSSPPQTQVVRSPTQVVGSPTQVVGSPTQVVSPTQVDVVSPAPLSDSASVSPTQLVPWSDERRGERGSKRSGALARHETLPRRKRPRDSPHFKNF